MGKTVKARNSWVRDAHVRGAAMTYVAILVAAWLLAFAGIGPAIDRVAQRGYYELRGARAAAPLLFVAIDEQTATAWGPPPWSWARYQQLIAPMRAGGARMIAMVEPGPRIVADEPVPAELTGGVAAGWLLIPTASLTYQQPALALSPAGVVDTIDLGDPANYSITRELVDRLGARAPGRTLPVNFIGEPDRLPTVPAHHVARGEIPPSTFFERVIVIGLRGERFTTSVPTPVGPMSPAEVHAHAVHALLSDAQLTSLPASLQLIVLVLVTAFGVFVLRRMRSASLLVATTVLTAAVLYGAGFLAFRFANAQLEIGAPSLGLLIAGLAGLVLERRDAMRGIDELRRQLDHRLRIDSSVRAGPTEQEILDRFAETLQTQLSVTSCVWAVLPPGRWHLELMRWYDGSDADVLEQRRDVRRDPWRLAYGSHKPEWASRPFLKEQLGQKSLLLPIAARGRLFGFWIVNMPTLRSVPDTQLRVLETFADDVAIALSKHRLEWQSAASRATEPGPAGAMVDAVQAARHDATTLAHAQDRTRAALEYLPIGVLSATSWGMIEHCNASMRRFLMSAGIASPERAGTAALLAELAGTSPGGARDMLREVGVLGKTVRFVVTVTEANGEAEPRRVPYDIVLTRVEIGDSAVGESVPTAVVLTAAPRQPDKEPSSAGSEDERMGQVIAFRKPGTD